MPNEILQRIVGWAPTNADAVSMGSTCRSMCAVVRDDSTWRLRFECLFGRTYARGASARCWPAGICPDDPWPEEALTFWRNALPIYESAYHTDIDRPDCTQVDGRSAFMWEPQTALVSPSARNGGGSDGSDNVTVGGHLDRRIPEPFAHMQVVGKDWRWLCRVHEAEPYVHGAPSLRPAGPGWMEVPKEVCSLRTRSKVAKVHHYGDISSTGAADGYGVEVHFDKRGRVLVWIEAQWRDDQIVGWRSIVDDKVAFYAMSDNNRTGPRLGFSVTRKTGERMWGPAMVCTMHGACLWIDRWGTRYTGLVHDGRRVTATAVAPQGDGSPVVGLSYDKRERVHGRAAVRYANGDVAVLKYEHGSLCGIVSFHCSPRCDDLGMAGRAFAGVSEWNWRCVPIRAGIEHIAFWPKAGADSDVGLFWRYVMQGRAGWHPYVQETVLRYAPCIQ